MLWRHSLLLRHPRVRRHAGLGWVLGRMSVAVTIRHPGDVARCVRADLRRPILRLWRRVAARCRSWEALVTHGK